MSWIFKHAADDSYSAFLPGSPLEGLPKAELPAVSPKEIAREQEHTSNAEIAKEIAVGQKIADKHEPESAMKHESAAAINPWHRMIIEKLNTLLTAASLPEITEGEVLRIMQNPSVSAETPDSEDSIADKIWQGFSPSCPELGLSATPMNGAMDKWSLAVRYKFIDLLKSGKTFSVAHTEALEMIQYLRETWLPKTAEFLSKQADALDPTRNHAPVFYRKLDSFVTQINDILEAFIVNFMREVEDRAEEEKAQGAEEQNSWGETGIDPARQAQQATSEEENSADQTNKIQDEENPYGD